MKPSPQIYSFLCYPTYDSETKVANYFMIYKPE